MPIIARTMSSSEDLNLTRVAVTTSGGTDPLGWPAGDWFGVSSYDAWPQVNGGMPFALADDSVAGVSGSVFAPDTQGIIDGTFPETQEFFGSVDTVNDTNAGGSATAEWTFDISGATDLSVSLDMAAMGDFETADTYNWSYSIDGGAFVPLFASSVDEAATQTYTMQNGTIVTLDDPMLMNGTTLDDVFQTISADLAGTGSALTIRVEGTSDGGTEAFAAANLVVEGTGGGTRGVIASEDFDGGATGLVSGFDAATDNLDGGPGDFFGAGSIGAWPQSAGLPFSLADDTVADVSGGGVEPGDAEGVFGQNRDRQDAFFALSDSDEFGAGQTASWTFDISGATDLSLAIDMGGISDSSFDGYSSGTDVTFTVSIDGGPAQTVFDLDAVEATGFTTRLMDIGTQSGGGRVLEVSGDNGVTKIDAETGLAAGNTFLDKSTVSDGALDTFIGGITGTGATVTVTMTADLPFEAMAFDNIEILGTAPQEPTLRVSLADRSLDEGETTQVIVSRTGDLSEALEVTLASSDETEASVPMTVTIAAGEASATATLTAVEDGIVDDDASVDITAAAAGFDDATTAATIRNVDVLEVAIYDIQGAGHVSEFAGQTVRTTGVVTALASGGFYLQDARGDGDVATSDGIFVRSGETVAIGDALVVTGAVTESDPLGGGADLDITTLVADGVEVSSSGNALPEAVLIGKGGRLAPTETFEDDNFTSFDPETDGVDFFESVEGMLVKAQDLRVVNGTNGFGEIFAVTDDGKFATGLSERGTLNISPDDFNPEKIQIDTDFTTSGFENPLVNVGARLGDVTGVVSYDFGNYQIVPTADFTGQVETPGAGDPDGRPLPPGLAKLLDIDVFRLPGFFKTVAERAKAKFEKILDKAGFDIDGPELSPEVSTLEGDASTLTVASYNVLNLDPVVEEPAQLLPNVSGGVDDDIGDGRFTAIAEQIVTNLNAPDIIGLQEIQDNTGAEGLDDITDASLTLETLIAEIEAAGGPSYEFFDNPFIVDDQSGGIPGGNIQTAFLYNPDRVTYVEDTLATIGGQGEGELFEGARLPLIAEFEFNGETVTVVNNHFSSKGGSAPIAGLEQPFAARQEDVTVNGSLDERRAQSEAVQDYVSGLLAEDPDANVVVLGDLNEFEFVSPVTGLEDAGLTNLTNTLPEDERYSFIFQGNSQSLDHILVSEALESGAEFDIVHVNTEFAETGGRASDHDPLLAALDFGMADEFILA